MSLNRLISCETLSPTTRNLVGLLADTPVIEIRKSDTGRKDADQVYRELRELAGNGFRVLEDSQSMIIVKDGTARSFLI
jgi:predicted transcriptional regulator